MGVRSFLTIFVAVLDLLSALHGHSVTGQITGTVADPTGVAVVGAAVRVTSDLSQQTRLFTTESNGTLTFTNLVPGNYKSLGLGSTPPTLAYGPGLISIDLNLLKEVRIKEQKRLQFGIQAFNALNPRHPAAVPTALS
jgi:hypothetical protein